LPESMIALLRARAPAAQAARGVGGRSGRLLGVLALFEGAVGDPLQQLGVVPQGADMAPVDLCAVKAREVCHAIGKPNSLAGF
jgi:hypothetical protein